MPGVTCASQWIHLENSKTAFQRWPGSTPVSCRGNVSYVLRELQHFFTLVPLDYLPSNSHGAMILASLVLTGSLYKCSYCLPMQLHSSPGPPDYFICFLLLLFVLWRSCVCPHCVCAGSIQNKCFFKLVLQFERSL